MYVCMYTTTDSVGHSRVFILLPTKNEMPCHVTSLWREIEVEAEAGSSKSPPPNQALAFYSILTSRTTRVLCSLRLFRSFYSDSSNSLMPKRKFRTVCKRVISKIVIIRKLKGDFSTAWVTRIMSDSGGTKQQRRQQLNGRLSVDRCAILELIVQLCSDNAAHFEKIAQSGSNGYNERMPAVQAVLQASIEQLKENIKKLQEVAPKYDYDEKTPGNGYRSLICICDTTLLHVVSLQKAVFEQRGYFVFRISHFCKELEAYATVIDYLNKSIPLCLQSEKNMRGSLFPPLDGNYETYQEILRVMEKLDSSVFFGRPIGFQFSPSINKIFRIIGIVLATYSLSWEKGHGAIGSLINTGRFFLSPEQRAERIIKVTREADIDFCKGFWNLSELSNNMPKFFCPNMALNELREIPLEGPIPMEGKQGEIVMVPEPSAHTGSKPVQFRILSAVHRQNMSSSALSTTHPPSKYLILHCHGGGYVATSSKSHETYLRQWAKALNCPVVSVEYSLAPENPFPRPTEEVLFAYSWIINNPAAVGWTGEKIVMVGDSAGGNLIMSVNIRLIQLNIKRQPDGLVLCYTPFLFQYLPSPSRMLSVMDPLLHMGVVLRCVAAYTGAYGAQINNNKLKKSQDVLSDGSDMYASHRSLLDYVNEVQKTKVDFSGGCQSIVSLVQKSHDNDGFAKTKGNSYYKKEESNEDEKFSETKVCLEKDEDGIDSEDDALETTSIASVQVDADPYHIQLNHTMHDDDLISFLSHHPITKNAMSMTPDVSEDDIELIEASVELGLEATESLVVEDENKDSKSGDEISTVSTENIPEAQQTKRPRLLQMLSSVTSRESRDTQTAPSTPSQQPKPISHSNSMNGFNPPMHKRSLSQSLAVTAASTAAYALDNLQDWFDRPQREKQKLDRTMSRKDDGEGLEEVMEEEEKPSHLLELVSSGTVPRDPLISPMYADDETIRELPPCYFLACHMDPLLDDTIAFAGKLRDAGGKVMSVDVLSSVPHGFLNFTLISPECKKSGKICINRLKEALGVKVNSKDETH
uniref:Hormone-sensitive lipase n=2 Tax=Caenorhabditis japonica TaxID=281687 RepID=A0A8R1HXG5_CAEJA